MPPTKSVSKAAISSMKDQVPLLLVNSYEYSSSAAASATAASKVPDSISDSTQFIDSINEIFTKSSDALLSNSHSSAASSLNVGEIFNDSSIDMLQDSLSTFSLDSTVKLLHSDSGNEPGLAYEVLCALLSSSVHLLSLFAGNKKPRVDACSGDSFASMPNARHTSAAIREVCVRSNNSRSEKTEILQELMRWNYFESHFCRLDSGTRMELFRQLCGPHPPADLLLELQRAINTTVPAPPTQHTTCSKQCPKCQIGFSGVIERYYHCGKTNNPYFTYKCAMCNEEYSDLQRLRPESSKQFKSITNDITLHPWIRQERTDKKSKKKMTCWVLCARGQKWTRCNDPDCHALYKLNNGSRNYRTIEKHRQKIAKIKAMEAELRFV